MLLAIDIGNTHIVIGLFDGEKLSTSWRLQSNKEGTVDEYALQLLGLIDAFGCKRESIKQVVIGCVVPPLTRVFSKLSNKYLNVNPIMVGPGIKTGLQIKCDDPRSVGADRIANAVAVKEKYGAPAIVVDFGTATTFDVLSEDASYQGGAIAPGLLISVQALYEKAAMLPTIELKNIERAIGKNTKESMLAGCMWGYVGLVEGLIKRINDEQGYKAQVIGTGGLCSLIAEHTDHIDVLVPDLTLSGLQIISTLNA